MPYIPFTITTVTPEAVSEALSQQGPKDTGNWVINAIMDSLREAVKSLFDKVQDIRSKINSKDFTGAIILVLEIAIPSFVLFVVVDLLTTKIVGAGLDLSGLKSVLQNFFKIDLFVSAIIGAWVGAGLKSPAEQIANMMFRPAIMSQDTALSLYLKGEIDENRFKDVMSRHGIPDGDIEYLMKDFDKKPSVTEIRAMYPLVEISDSNLEWLLRQNFIVNPYVTNLYKRYLKAYRLRDEYSYYQSWLKSAYIDGLITDDQLEEELSRFKISTDEINAVIDGVKNQASRQLTKMEIDTLTWYYRKGLYAEKLILESTATADGNSEGSTLIDASRGENDNYWKNFLIRITSGPYKDHTAYIKSWTKSTHTFTISPPVGGTISANTTYEILQYTPESTFYDYLMAIGVRSEVANAIVRNEAAKKGIVFEAPVTG